MGDVGKTEIVPQVTVEDIQVAGSQTPPEQLKKMGFKHHPERPKGSLGQVLNSWFGLSEIEPGKKDKVSSETRPDKGALYDRAARAGNDLQRRYQLIEVFQPIYFHPKLRFSGARDKQPVEASATMLLLDAYGAGKGGKDYYREGELLGKGIKAALEVVRSNGWSSLGIEGFVQRDSYQAVIVNVNAAIASTPEAMMNERDVMFNQQTIFDGAVIASLACGDPNTALLLINNADRINFRNKRMAKEYALSRMVNRRIFERAWEIYPRDAREQFDSVFASIGKGSLNGIGNLFGSEKEIAALQKQSEERVRERVRKELEYWYSSQAIVDEQKREKGLAEEAVAGRIDIAVQHARKWTDLEKDIEHTAELVVDGRVANSIAGELERRLTPQAQVGVVVGNITSESLYKGRVNEDIPNAYKNARRGENGEVSQAGREQVIASIYPREDKIRAMVIGRNNGVDYETLIAFLRDPERYMLQLSHTLSKMKEEVYNSGTPQQDFLTRIDKYPEEAAMRLFPAVRFIEVLAENPQTRRVLVREFGLKDVIAPVRLEKVNGVMLESVQKLNKPELGEHEDIIDKDGKTVEELEGAMVNEKVSLAKQTEQAVAGIIDSKIADISAEHARYSSRLAEREKPQKQLVNLVHEEGEVNAELEIVRNTPSVHPIMRMIKGGMTAAEKREKEGQLEKRLQEMRGRIEGVNEQLHTIGSVDQSHISRLERHREALEQLRPPLEEKAA